MLGKGHTGQGKAFKGTCKIPVRSQLTTVLGVDKVRAGFPKHNYQSMIYTHGHLR